MEARFHPGTSAYKADRYDHLKGLLDDYVKELNRTGLVNGCYRKSTGKWIPNHHCHMIFDWIDHKTGKSFKLNKYDTSKLQTLVAESLGMERG